MKYKFDFLTEEFLEELDGIIVKNDPLVQIPNGINYIASKKLNTGIYIRVNDDAIIIDINLSYKEVFEAFNKADFLMMCSFSWYLY